MKKNNSKNPCSAKQCLTVNKMVPPSPEQWEAVIQGMRLPLLSGDKYDSCIYETLERSFTLGNEDYNLATGLTKTGSSDRKFLRQLPIIMEVKADQVFWRQCDQYKIGTVTNSSSQMHKLKDTEFTLDDFNIPFVEDLELDVQLQMENWIKTINRFIKDSNKDKEAGADGWKDEWDFALSLIPQSVFYTKCWSLNYETAINIGLQREGHKNGAWDILIDYWKNNLPYYKTFLDAAKFKQNEVKHLKDIINELENENVDLARSLNNISSYIENGHITWAGDRVRLNERIHELEEKNEELEKENEEIKLTNRELAGYIDDCMAENRGAGVE